VPQFAKGERIKLLSMPDDPDPIPGGTCGTIKAVLPQPDWVQYIVAWDAPHSHRTLSVSVPPDVIVKY
jgi:hypothetical protein